MATIISPERFNTLKQKVKEECLRRSHNTTNGSSVSAYGGTSYDYSVTPADGIVIQDEHRIKNAVPLNAINSTKVATSGINVVLEDDIANMEAFVTTCKSRNLYDTTGTDCNGSCTGLCYGSCTSGCSGCGSGCANTCSGGCSGCTGCTGCSGCGSGCANTCSGGCKGCTGCTGCSGCGNGCANTCSGGCKGCTGCTNACEGCGSGCGDGCKGDCYTTCKGSCSGGCSGTCMYNSSGSVIN